MLNLIKAYRKYDPATTSSLEILLFYPGIKAIFFHRLANFFWHLKVPLLPRGIAEFSRWITGIEIHPAAKIGNEVIIDHGMGLVIGATAVVGNNVLLFHGVTLGGTTFERGKKRHPTLEDNVVVGAGAKILGNICIGAHSRVGANSVVIESAPPHSTLVGIPAKNIGKGVKPGHELCHDEICIDITISKPEKS